MNNIIEKKLLLNIIYKKYLKTYSNYKNFLILNDSNDIHKIFCKKFVKDGNFIILQNYFINIKLMHLHNLKFTLQLKNLIKKYNKKKIIYWKNISCKFEKIIILKSVIGGYFCINKGIFIYCSNDYLKNEFIRKNTKKLVSQLSIIHFLTKQNILNTLFLINNQNSLIKKSGNIKIFIKYKWKINKSKKKKKSKRYSIYFLKTKKLNFKYFRHKKFRYKFKVL